MSLWDELSFLAVPGQVQDWRMILLYDAAVDAGVLAALPATPAQLEGRLGLDGHAVEVVLRALAAWDVVAVGDDGAYAAGEGAPAGDAASVLRHHARSMRMWSAHLDDRLRGRVVSRGPVDPRRVELMLEALAVNGRESAPAAVSACLERRPGARRVLDAGGGHGEYAMEFARRGLQATMQDRPDVIDTARRHGHLAQAGVQLFAGDFFDTLPDEAFDLVFCAGVTYTFDAERNLLLYRRLRSVLAPDGVLAIHTFLGGTDPLASIFAVQMVAASTGGDSHGEDDHRRWLQEAGYRSVESQRLQRRPEWMVFASP